MIWFLRAGRFFEAALIAVVGGALSGLFSGRAAPVPSVTAGALTPAPVVALLAFIPLIALLRVLDNPSAGVVVVSTRPVGSYRGVIALGLGLLTSASAFTVAGPAASLEAVRNVGGLFGLAVLGWVARGRGAALAVPITFVLTSYLLGRTDPTTVTWWAWILRDPHDLLAALLATLLTGAGLAALATLPRTEIRRGAA